MAAPVVGPETRDLVLRAARNVRKLAAMRWVLPTLAMLATPALLGTGAVPGAPGEFLAEGGADEGGVRDVPACIAVSKEVRYRNYGYDHIVVVANGCSRMAVCTVSTDVNPTPIAVRVDPGERARVVTYIGSPSRVFTAAVRCSLETGS